MNPNNPYIGKEIQVKNHEKLISHQSYPLAYSAIFFNCKSSDHLGSERGS
jgi:hypothetical protein